MTAILEHRFGRMRTAPESVGTTRRSLTQAIDSTDWRAAMNGTRLSGNDSRRIAERPHPDFSAAVTVSRFWRLVDRREPNECWPWLGHLDQHGYGIFTLDGRRIGAHQLALSFTTGEKKHAGLDTCHACDFPACCNPNHLRFDTRQSNVADARDRDRISRGSRTTRTKLTEEQVVVIRERRALGARHKDLALDFGITESAVTSIVHGRNWKHVGGPITNRNKEKTA